MSLHPVDPKTLAPAMLAAFGAENALLTAGDREARNTMTIGWFQAGRLWNLPVCTVYVRPERHTFRFMEDNPGFSVSVLPAGMKEAMVLCGTKSGRDMDKIAACGLTVRYSESGVPFFEEAEQVLICKTIFVQDMAPECVRDDRILAQYGAKGGWHRIYTGEMLEAYTE